MNLFLEYVFFPLPLYVVINYLPGACGTVHVIPLSPLLFLLPSCQTAAVAKHVCINLVTILTVFWANFAVLTPQDWGTIKATANLGILSAFLEVSYFCSRYEMSVKSIIFSIWTNFLCLCYCHNNVVSSNTRFWMQWLRFSLVICILITTSCCTIALDIIYCLDSSSVDIILIVFGNKKNSDVGIDSRVKEKLGFLKDGVVAKGPYFQIPLCLRKLKLSIVWVHASMALVCWSKLLL